MSRRLSTLAFLVVLPLAAKTYAVDGIVVAVDPAARTMLVSHRAIAHYMPAMLMPFRAESRRNWPPSIPAHAFCSIFGRQKRKP